MRKEENCIQCLPNYNAVTVACHVIPASGRLVDGDILELSVSPCYSVGICCTRMELGWQMVKELDLELTERR